MKKYSVILVVLFCLFLGYEIGKKSVVVKEEPMNLEQGICVDAIKRMNLMSREKYTYYNEKQSALDRMMKN